MMINKPKQRRHIRRVHTSRGVVPILINKNYRGPVRSRRVFLRPSEKKALVNMSKYPAFDKEFGGSIDFDLKGEVEKMIVVPGKKGYVDLEELDKDYEVMFHTHPSNMDLPPSPEDVVTFLKNKDQQAEMIIAKDNIFVVSKPGRLVKPKSYKALERDLMEYYDSIAGGEKGWINDWLTYVNDVTGLNIKKVRKDKNKPVELPITPVEPRLFVPKKNKKKTGGVTNGFF